MRRLKPSALLFIWTLLPASAAELSSSGTGFAVGSGGYLLTNAHVVSGCASVTARMSGREVSTVVISIDSANDLALLRAPMAFPTALRLRVSPRIQLGETAVAFGYPLQGIISTSLNMTTGNISALAGLDDDARWIQFTAPIQPGNSGGPLVDASGSLLGVVTSKLSPFWAAKKIGDIPQNVNFALRSSVVRDFLESRGVEYQVSESDEGVPLTGLPGRVTGAVVPLRCYGDEAGDRPGLIESADSASLAQGKALLARVQQSLGGAEKLGAVKDLQMHANLEVLTPGVTTRVKQTTSFIIPSVFRQDNELAVFKQSVYSDGTSGWLAGMQGIQNLPPPVLRQIHGEAFRLLVGLALSDRDPDRTVSLASPGVLEISSKDGESVRLTVDDKTGLPEKLGYQQSPAEGGAAVEEIFSDWRDIDGLHLPFQWDVMQKGKKFAGVSVQDYKINSGLTTEALGTKPPPQAPFPIARPPAGQPSAPPKPAPQQ